MKQLTLLLKVHLLNVMGINRMRYGHDDEQTKKTRRNIGLMIVIAFLLLPSIFAYFYGMGVVLETLGGINLLMGLAVAAGCIAVLVTTVAGAANTLFCFRDFDATVSLPIPHHIVVLSRVLRLYGTNLVFLLMIMVPALVAYGMFVAVDVGLVLRYLLLTLFLPAIPIIVASALSTLIARIASHSRKKSLVSTILLLIFVIAMIAFSMFSRTIGEEITSLIASMASSVYGIYPPAAWFESAVCAGSAGDLLLFVGVSVAVYALFVLCVSKFFKPLNAALTSSSAKRRAAKESDIKTSSQFTALLNKEAKRYFASSIYVANTLVGPILTVLVSIAALVVGRDGLMSLLGDVDGLDVSGVIGRILPFVLMFFQGLSVTTTASISIEGKNLWQIKSLPIEPKSLFKAKLGLSLILVLPPVLLASVALPLALGLTFMDGLLMWISVSVFSVFISVTGLLFNLRNPRFDWKTDQEVVKQGMPILFNMLITMVLSMAFGVAAAMVPFSPYILTGGISVVLAILAAVLWNGIVKNGAEKFKKFN